MPSLSNVAAQNLQRLIANGTYAVGKTLPSQRDLASPWASAAPVCAEAVSMLEHWAWCVPTPAKGVFVTAGTGRDAGYPANPAGMRPGHFPVPLRARAGRAGMVAADQSGAEGAHPIQARLEAALRRFDLVEGCPGTT